MYYLFKLFGIIFSKAVILYFVPSDLGSGIWISDKNFRLRPKSQISFPPTDFVHSDLGFFPFFSVFKSQIPDPGYATTQNWSDNLIQNFPGSGIWDLGFELCANFNSSQQSSSRWTCLSPSAVVVVKHKIVNEIIFKN